MRGLVVVVIVVVVVDSKGEIGMGDLELLLRAAVTGGGGDVGKGRRSGG